MANRDLVWADAADGDVDGEIGLENAYKERFSWKIEGEAIGDDAGGAVATGDLDGNGTPDLIIGAAGTTLRGSRTWAPFTSFPARF